MENTTTQGKVRLKAGYIWLFVAVNVVGVSLALLFNSNYAEIERIRQEALKPIPFYKEVPEDRSVQFYIQAGSFFDLGEAQARMKLLQSQGAVVEMRETEKKGFRVFVLLCGPMNSPQQVFLLREKLHLLGIETIKLRQLANGSLVAAG